MSVLLLFAAAVIVGLLVATRRLSRQVSDLEREIRAGLAREAAAARETAAARRGAAEAELDRQFLARFVRELPHVAHELHAGGGTRHIPMMLLNAIVRLIKPEKAMIAIARRPTEPGLDAATRLTVAAVAPDGAVPLGMDITAGRGEVGFAVEVQRVMDRHDFDTQPAGTRNRLRDETGLEHLPDVVAPMVFKNEVVGVIALEGLKRSSRETKDMLRMVSLVGAVSLYTQARYSEMRATANLDGLTAVFNKRYMTQRLAEEIQKALAETRSVSAFLFDIDNFKHYNDRNGHLAGDQLLKALSKLVQENTRRDTTFGRFGGDEFLMIFPDTGKAQALRAAENVREAIALHDLPFRSDQPLGCVSISGGVAEFPVEGMDGVRLLRAADEALYAAKRAGRNRVLAFEPHYLGGDEPQEPAAGDQTERAFARLAAASRSLPQDGPVLVPADAPETALAGVDDERFE